MTPWRARDVPAGMSEVAAGATSRDKTFCVSGDPARLATRLEAL
jgi:class 3 adenylate cyclase